MRLVIFRVVGLRSEFDFTLLETGIFQLVLDGLVYVLLEYNRFNNCFYPLGFKPLGYNFFNIFNGDNSLPSLCLLTFLNWSISVNVESIFNYGIGSNQ